jgi:hypothetical protein
VTAVRARVGESAHERFRELRRLMIPFAQAQGIYTDEGVFNLVS